MAIDTNDYSPQSPEARRENQEFHTDFQGTTLGDGAPTGTTDFLSLIGKIGISRIDSTVEPYLEKVLQLVKDNLPSVARIRLDRLTNSYAFRFDGPDGSVNFFGILFANLTNPVSQNLVPESVKLKLIQEELKTRFSDKKIRLVDARVIIAGYEPDMARAVEMADTIVRTFQMTSISELKNAQIMSIVSNEFVADWSLHNAKAAESQLSPHGVRPRMDVGLTLKAKIRNQFEGREFRDMDADYRTLGVIGGYTEIRDKEIVTINNQQVLMYRPVFNITVCNATLPLEGVAAILMAALAPTIYSTLFWARQWSNLTEGQPNPGLLEQDPQNPGRPYVLKDQDELQQFIRTYFTTPVIAFQFQDGRDSIPGVWRLASTGGDAKSHFMTRLTHFFGAPDENSSNVELSRVFETRFDGVYGDPSGTLHDSRDIDYLYIASKLGTAAVDPAMRRALLGGSENATDRARIVQNAVHSFIPTALNTLAVVNPEFIKWIINKTDAQRMVIVDPARIEESRSIGSFTDGFGAATNMGSIVSSGQTRQGLNLHSVWQY